MKNIVIINEQHSLLPEQKQLIARLDGIGGTLKVPRNGWTLQEIYQVEKRLHEENTGSQRYIFVSPVPVLLGLLCRWSSKVYVFHNDKREKKELPNGKIIYTVAEDGWQLVPIR